MRRALVLALLAALAAAGPAARPRLAPAPGRAPTRRGGQDRRRPGDLPVAAAQGEDQVDGPDPAAVVDEARLREEPAPVPRDDLAARRLHPRAQRRAALRRERVLRGVV